MSMDLLLKKRRKKKATTSTHSIFHGRRAKRRKRCLERFQKNPSWCLGNRFIATVHFLSWIIHGNFIKKIFCKDAKSALQITLCICAALMAVVQSRTSSEPHSDVLIKNSVSLHLHSLLVMIDHRFITVGRCSTLGIIHHKCIIWKLNSHPNIQASNFVRVRRSDCETDSQGLVTH